ncbi:MAG: NAD(P)-dependent oxidoreductase, partial [bacterium]
MIDSDIFIVGANGQLGLALRAKYPGAKWADKDELDITNKDSVSNFDWSGIKVILNAAAYTNVDGAETPEGRVAAWAVNADAVGNLVAVAAQYDMTIVHISTDYVFDGSQKLHTEDEPFSPLSVYGASKAAGDLLVSLAPKFYIIRTSWVIGDGKNFVNTMLGLAQKGINPTVVADQIGRLTFTNTLVSAISHLLGGVNTSNIKLQISNIDSSFPYGTYNVSNDG